MRSSDWIYLLIWFGLHGFLHLLGLMSIVFKDSWNPFTSTTIEHLLLAMYGIFGMWFVLWTGFKIEDHFGGGCDDHG